MSEKVLLCGNEALGEAAIRAGCQFYAGYPITPQNELTAHMARRMPELGRVFIQPESEIAAVNMIYGASAAGYRVFTSSSSPGISLKQEGISYLVGAELPAVIANIMRGGPGLGNISPAQSDYFQATRGGGHGDYRNLVFGPETVQELVDITLLAFEIADRYRNPVLILGDALLGQMMEPVELPDFQEPPDPREKAWALSGARGRERNIVRSLYLGPGNLEGRNRLLQEKFARIAKEELRWEEVKVEDADLVLVAYGTMARVCRGVLADACREGKRVGLLRPLTLWPFPLEIVEKRAAEGKRFLVVEMSAGQMVEDVKLGAGKQTSVDFYGRAGGGIPSRKEIMDKLREII